MSSRIRWSQWMQDGTFCCGYIERTAIQEKLAEFRKEAVKLLKATGADHVVYGVKFYDQNGELEEIRFYLSPMSEEKFERDVASIKGVVVYAVHK